MRRHRGLAATLAGGFLAVGFLQIPAHAQRSRVAEREDSARPAVERSVAERPAVERPAVERPIVQRASPPREVTAPVAARPAGLVANVPDNSSHGRPAAAPVRQSEPDKSRDSGRGGGYGYGGGEGPGQDNDWREGHKNSNRQDGGRHGNGYGGATGIVVYPIVVAPVGFGTAGTYVSHPSETWSEETVYLDDLRREQRVEVSDEPVERSDGDLGEPLEPDEQTRRMEPSLASLGAQYSFRPWYAVSEFVMAGYPVPYPEPLAATYDKRALAKNADLPPAAVEALRSGMPLVPFAPGTFGGVTFQIGPADAAVYVDGVFAGLAEDFTPVTAPLPLMVGVHRVELRVRGFRVEKFDVIVTNGQVTPLSGLLAPQ